MTTEERIQFAVDFAATNLDHNRAGDWLNLRDDLKHFLGAAIDDDLNIRLGDACFICAMPEEISAAGEWKKVPTEADMKRLQSNVRELLLSFAGPYPRHKPGEVITAKPAKTKPVPVNLQYEIMRLRNEEGEASEAIVRGTLSECLLAVLLLLLLQRPGTPIELCPACGKVFYRRGKRTFCSRTCTDRAMTNRKRDRDRERALKHKTKGKTTAPSIRRAKRSK